jgi:RimJ/RimL family protein N-acetyltransferase
MPAPILKTKRLILRNWTEEDLHSFAKMNADKRAMEFFPSVLSEQESNTLAEKIQQELTEKDYGFWAVEVVDGPPFIGFVGLHYQDFTAPFTPCIEIGWRLTCEHQGKGYALEAAKKVIQYAFNTLKLKEIVSFTTPDNKRSWGLMKKLGMTHNPLDDFHHTKLPKNNPLSFHLLYRLKNQDI